MKRIYKYMYVMLFLVTTVACKKEFLNEKPNRALLVPTTIADVQALLDNSSVLNIEPGLNLISADEFVTSDNAFDTWSSPAQRNSYVWNEDIYEGQEAYDWNLPYTAVFYANVALDALEKMDAEQKKLPQWSMLKGSALFFRGMSFWYLAQMFAENYTESSASNNPGIPMPLISDVNRRYDRGTVKGTYDQILSDLKASLNLVPEHVLVKSRPNKATANAFIARVYLSMQNYLEGEKYATESLNLYNKLIDYNSLNQSASNSFPETLPSGNEECLFFINSMGYSFNGARTTIIDPDLFGLYDSDDIRKYVFFRNRGNGVINSKTYGGLSVAEIYLIRAECKARREAVTEAMSDLNAILIKRYVTGTFVARNAVTGADALDKILLERQKELACKGSRWYDLKRLNKEGRFAKTLTRKVKGASYALLPNDARYVFPIPNNEIKISKLAQNKR